MRAACKGRSSCEELSREEVGRSAMMLIVNVERMMHSDDNNVDDHDDRIDMLLPGSRQQNADGCL